MIEQRTKEWHEQRKRKVTGSQAGAILGDCPWRSRDDVMNDWLYGSDFKGNAATEYGNFHEPQAIADFELATGITVGKCGFYVHPEYDWLGASPDGLIVNDSVLEVKCPFGFRDNENPEFKNLKDQPHYYAQVQLQMACTGRKKAYFYQWNRFSSHLEVIDYDDDYIQSIIPKLLGFIDEFKERQKELESDKFLAVQYHFLKSEADAAIDLLEKHKKLMIEKASGKKRKFGDVSVYPVERKGSVAYSKAIKELMPDADLEQWRGKSSVSWVVK